MAHSKQFNTKIAEKTTDSLKDVRKDRTQLRRKKQGSHSV